MKPYNTLIRDIKGMNKTTNLDSTRQVSMSKGFIIYTRAQVLFFHERVLVKVRKICFSDLELTCSAPRRQKSVNIQLTWRQWPRELRKIFEGEKNRSYFLCWGLCHENWCIKVPMKDLLRRSKISILFGLLARNKLQNGEFLIAFSLVRLFEVRRLLARS